MKNAMRIMGLTSGTSVDGGGLGGTSTSRLSARLEAFQQVAYLLGMRRRLDRSCRYAFATEMARVGTSRVRKSLASSGVSPVRMRCMPSLTVLRVIKIP